MLRCLVVGECCHSHTKICVKQKNEDKGKYCYKKQKIPYTFCTLCPVPRIQEPGFCDASDLGKTLVCRIWIRNSFGLYFSLRDKIDLNLKASFLFKVAKPVMSGKLTICRYRYMLMQPNYNIPTNYQGRKFLCMWWHIFLSGSAGSVADMMQPRNSSRNSLISFSSLSSLRRRKRLIDRLLPRVFDVMTTSQPVLGIWLWIRIH